MYGKKVLIHLENQPREENGNSTIRIPPLGAWLWIQNVLAVDPNGWGTFNLPVYTQ